MIGIVLYSLMKQKSTDFALMVAVGVGFVMDRVEVLEWCNKLSSLEVGSDDVGLLDSEWP
jgi:hypothetical protein